MKFGVQIIKGANYHLIPGPDMRFCKNDVTVWLPWKRQTFIPVQLSCHWICFRLFWWILHLGSATSTPGLPAKESTRKMYVKLLTMFQINIDSIIQEIFFSSYSIQYPSSKRRGMWEWIVADVFTRARWVPEIVPNSIASMRTEKMKFQNQALRIESYMKIRAS